MSRVLIHYVRPPDDEEVFEQHVIRRPPRPGGAPRAEGAGAEGAGADAVVTLALDLRIDAPKSVAGRIVLEPGSDVVWFTFPGRWHDIGRFHTADGAFRGWYANILTPPVFETPAHGDGPEVWRTTDLFLDVWVPFDGGPATVLDRDQFDEAVRRGWIDGHTAGHAVREVDRILEAHTRGVWPPRIAREWTLRRAKDALRRQA